MRKSYISILLAVISCFIVFAFAGCSKTTENVETITDIEFYADMQAGGDKIVVDYENGTREGFIFTIEDKADIDEIVNLVLTSRLTNVGNEPVAPGDNTHFTVYQGEKAYGIALSGVRSNNDRYIFSEIEALGQKISAIAIEKGAHDVA